MNKQSQYHNEMVDITLAKGLGIFLVVVGHIMPGKASEGNEWFDIVMNVIYMFHMPFFMAISGFVYFRQKRIEEIYANYAQSTYKDFKRLMLPFCAIGITVLIGKIVAGSFLHVDKAPPSVLDVLSGLFYDTKNSPATFIWYVYVLFIYRAFAPVWFKLTRFNLWMAAALGFVLYFAPRIDYFYMDKMLPFFIFFIYGCALRRYKDIYEPLVDRYGPLFMVAFFAGMYLVYNPELHEYTHVKLISGALAFPALHWLCRIMAKGAPLMQKIFYELGQSSYPIYLFNTICIGVTKAVMFKITHWHGMNFFFFAPILILGGLIGPMIIERIYAMRYVILDYIRKSRQCH